MRREGCMRALVLGHDRRLFRQGVRAGRRTTRLSLRGQQDPRERAPGTQALGPSSEQQTPPSMASSGPPANTPAHTRARELAAPLHALLGLKLDVAPGVQPACTRVSWRRGEMADGTRHGNAREVRRQAASHGSFQARHAVPCFQQAAEPRPEPPLRLRHWLCARRPRPCPPWRRTRPGPPPRRRTARSAQTPFSAGP